MKTHRIRVGRRARKRRRRLVRGSGFLFRRFSSFEGLELRTVLSGGSLVSSTALEAADNQETDVSSLSVGHLLASNLSGDAPAAAPMAAGAGDGPTVNPFLVEGVAIDVFLRAEDLQGSEITGAEIGDEFRLLAFVDDVRTAGDLFGVFSAYVRATYDADLVSVVPDTLSVSDFFDDLEVKTDLSTLGEIRGGGATLEFGAAPGSDPQLLWSVTMRAGGGGTASFGTFFETFSDDAFPAEWLVFGDDDPLTADNVTFGTLELSITGPDVEISDVTALETDENQEFVFTVSLSEASTRQISVEYTTNDGTATAPADYVAQSGTLTFDAGVTEQTVTITVVGDNDQEDEETFTVNLSNPDGAGLGDDTGTGTIENDDTTTIGISDVSQLEGDEQNVMVFTVTISEATTSGVVVSFVTMDGTAEGDSDYQATTGAVTFAGGSAQSQLISVVINGDTDFEQNETFEVVLLQPDNAVFDESGGRATGELVNDDGPRIEFVNNQVSQLEDITEFVFTVTINEAGDGPVTVEFTTTDGSAAAGSDYTANSGTLTFTGQTITQDITVTVNNDQLDEDDESFSIVLSNQSANATLLETTATATIEDDDPLPTLSIDPASESEVEGSPIVFTVSLSSPSGREVTVEYVTVDGTAIAGSDYEGVIAPETLTFMPGETQQLVTVIVTTDALVEPDETFQLRLFNPTNVSNTEDLLATGTIENDDLPTVSISAPPPQAEGDEFTTRFEFTVTLSAASDETVTVNFFTLDGTATTADLDYNDTSGTVTFAPGSTSETIVVLVRGDTREEGNEDFMVRLGSSPVGAVLGTSTATATIVDDETPPTLSIDNVTGAEGDSGTTPFVFTVSMSRETLAPVTVSFATADGTATVAGVDYQAASGTLTFAAGETSKVITVNVVGDTFFEANETFSVQLSNITGATLANGIGTGTIESESTDEVSDLPSSISGKVFVDGNGDGLHNGTEMPFAGQAVFLTGPTNLQTSTGPDGSYFFNNLQPGTYTVSFTQPLQYQDGVVHVGTQGGDASVGAFTFTIESPGGIVGTENNFTTSGLLGQFISQRLFLASSLGALTNPPTQDVTVAISTVTDPINAAGVINTAISGTGTPGVTISVVATDGNNSTAPMFTTVDASGDWSIAGIMVGALADGTLTYNVTATGTGNSTATDSATTTKDTLAPTVNIDAVTDPINASNADDTSIGGTTEAGASVSVEATDGTNTVTAQTTADGNGNWSVGGIDTTNLADGTITYTVTATDAAGNSGSNTTAALKDTESPNVDLTMVVPDPINADEQDNVTLNGTGEIGVEISVNVADANDSIGPFTTTVDANGEWTIAGIDVSSLDDGTLTITVVATDSATNTETIMETVEKDTVTEVMIDPVTSPITSADVEMVTASGTGEAGATVSVVADDGSNSTDAVMATVDAGGDWSLVIDVSALDDGTLTFTATATDLAGNTDEDSTTADKDTMATVDIDGVTNPIGIGDDDAVSISGTGEAGADIEVVVSDGVNSTAAVMTTVAGDGTWSIAGIDVSALADGTLTFTVSTTDLVGNTGQDSITAQKSTLEIASVTDPINADNVEMVMIEGTGEIDATVFIMATDGQAMTEGIETTIDGSGNWSAVIDVSGLLDGTVTFDVTATDGDTNTIEKSITAEKDTVTDVTIDSVTDPINAALQTMVMISGTGEVGATVSVVADDSLNSTDAVMTTIDGNGDWSLVIDVSALDDGTLTFTAMATDLVGNTDEDTRTATKDTVAMLGIIGVTDPIGIGDDDAVSISGTGEAGADIEVVVSDGSTSTDAVMETVAGDGTWTIDNIDVSALMDGTLTFTVSTRDVAGNTGEDSITAEKSTLVIAMVTDPINATDQTMVMISGTGEIGAGISITATDDQTTTDPVVTTIDGSGNWSAPIDVSGLLDGTVTFDVTADDGNTNTIEKSITAEKDTVTDVTIDSVTDPINADDQTLVMISGTGEVGATVSVVADDSVNSTDAVMTTVDAGGDWSLVIDVSALDDGTLTFTAMATDLAGNTDEETTTATKDTITMVQIADVTDPIGIGDDDAVSISGTGEVDAQISVVASDGSGFAMTMTTVAGDGTWSIDDLDVSALDDGTLTFIVTAEDLAGNTAQANVAAQKSTLAIAMVTDPINAVDADMVMIEGTGEIGAEVSITATDDQTTTDAVMTTIDGSGNWSAQIDVSALLDGTLTFTVTATDGDTNMIEKMITAEKDTVTQVAITGVTDPISPENADDTSIDGTGENGAEISVVVTDGVNSTVAFMITVTNGTWSIAGIDVTALNNGTLTYMVTATDGAGNTAQDSITAEKVAPAAPLAMLDGEDDEELEAVAMALSAASDDADAIDEALAGEGDWMSDVA